MVRCESIVEQVEPALEVEIPVMKIPIVEIIPSGEPREPIVELVQEIPAMKIPSVVVNDPKRSSVVSVNIADGMFKDQSGKY